jgi:hypothetical protein
MDKREDLWWMRIEVITCFVIWRKRSTKIFREENKSPMTLVREILIEYKN